MSSNALEFSFSIDGEVVKDILNDKQKKPVIKIIEDQAVISLKFLLKLPFLFSEINLLESEPRS